MCGIFGLVKHEECDISNKEFINSVTKLFRFSETRGSEAAGIALNTRQGVQLPSIVREHGPHNKAQVIR